jgi:RND family efflux transporter MFP subunit
MKLLLIVVALAAVGAVAMVATRKPATPPAAAAISNSPIELASVDVATVEPRVLPRSLPLSGSIAPFVQATLKSKVGGEVEQLKLREGQDVREGEVIARVDTRNLQAQYDREAAAVEKARADLDLARLNRDKNRSLLEQRFISQNTFEQTESAYAGSVASFKLAEAQARVAKINLDDAVIRAPFSGTIAKRLVQPGEKVSPDSAIVTLVDLKQMVLEAAVPAAEIPSVRVGQKVRFRVGGFGDRQFEGEVQRINPMTTDGSRAIALYIAVANADSALKGGMFAQGELTLNTTEPVLAVAQRAVREEAGASYVYTLRDDKVVRTPVKLGPSSKSDAFVEVRDGLSAGDRVIVADIGHDKAGTVARIRQAEASASEVASRL